MFSSYRNDVSAGLLALSQEKVGDVVNILRRAKFRQSAVYLVGNGGSAATCSHFANDLLKVAGIRAYSVPDMVPAVSAYGNDEDWDKSMYAGPLRRMLKTDDVLVAFSCSGNSRNVVESIRMAKDLQLPSLKTVLLTGADVNSEAVKLQPDVVVYVPFKDIRVQEDCHLVICHAIIGALSNG